MTKTEAQNLFNDLIRIGGNIQRIYEKLGNDLDSKETKKQLAHLELALEYEDRLYQNFKEENINELYAFFRHKYQITSATYKAIKEIPMPKRPIYRIGSYLSYLQRYWSNPNLGIMEYFLPQEAKEEMKKQLRNQHFEEMVINLQFILTSANIATMQGEGTRTDYLNIIYFNRVLESELFPSGFELINLDEIPDFARRAWYMFELKFQANPKVLNISKATQDTYMQFQEDLILNDINSIKSHSCSLEDIDDQTLLTYYFILPVERQRKILLQLEEAIKESTGYQKIKLIIIASKIIDIINQKINQKENKRYIRIKEWDE